MKGKITISKYSNDVVGIELVDDVSGIVFVEVEMGLEDFAKALFSLAHVNCEFKHRPNLVGKTREIKMEEIEVPDGAYRFNDEELHSLISSYEVDGWVGDVSDLNNSHRSVRRASNNTFIQRVNFVRFVDPKES